VSRNYGPIVNKKISHTQGHGDLNVAFRYKLHFAGKSITALQRKLETMTKTKKIISCRTNRKIATLLKRLSYIHVATYQTPTH
jgi:hypothetical protein